MIECQVTRYSFGIDLYLYSRDETCLRQSVTLAGN